ncbi:MAG TPA: DUF6046 domain-containing protein [Spirochaetota bacterium]|nr:DUF6046 domain-containing protein [Spirochaetota bacterium]HRZ27138.1 DUF6046 domain-containing protein [Spirochaetota bacterium]
MVSGGIIPQPAVSPLAINGFVFPIEPLVDVRGGKNIVKTTVPGLDGTVKEFLGFDDYVIMVNVIIEGATRSDVLAQLEAVIKIWKIEESLVILCPKTAEYGIDRVVFESFDHPETEGMPSTERLTLRFVSDKEYDFEVI